MQTLAAIVITLFVCGVAFGVLLKWQAKNHEHELKENDLNWRLQLERIASGVFNEALEAMKYAHKQELKNMAEYVDIKSKRADVYVEEVENDLITIVERSSDWMPESCDSETAHVIRKWKNYIKQKNEVATLMSFKKRD
jgi:hypothetical protein